jgi:hypothetical protein
MSKTPAPLHFRATDEQKAEIGKRAKAAGLDLSKYLRKSALGELGTSDSSTQSERGDASGHQKASRRSRQVATHVAQPEGQEQDGSPADKPSETEADFIERRTKYLHGKGKTMRRAKSEARAEWKAKEAS